MGTARVSSFLSRPFCFVVLDGSIILVFVWVSVFITMFNSWVLGWWLLFNGLFFILFLFLEEFLNNFVLNIYHGGSIDFDNDEVKYVGGRVSHLDYANVDKMSIVELDGILKKKLGYHVGAVSYVA